MSGWQPGDLALCLRANCWEIVSEDTYDGPHPVSGEINMVSEIYPADGAVCLCFDAYPDNGYYSDAFRKIVPDHSACEEEFITLLQLSKKQGADA